MAANLIDNACKYGTSQVIVRLLPALNSKGLFEIVVEDDGPGLSEEQIARAMERGARLDEAAPGQGLGLSILTETVELSLASFCLSAASLAASKRACGSGHRLSLRSPRRFQAGRTALPTRPVLTPIIVMLVGVLFAAAAAFWTLRAARVLRAAIRRRGVWCCW